MRKITKLIFFCAVLCSFEAAAENIPFEYRDGFIWIRVDIAGEKESFNFLLDSGAEVSTVDLRTATRLGLKLGKTVRVQGVESSVAGYWPVQVPATTALLPLPAKMLAVDLCDLSKSCRCDVHGLIGADFFRNRVVQIDFTRRTLRLLKAAHARPGDFVLPMRLQKNALLTQLKVNEQKEQWFRLDTGCASSLQWASMQSRARTLPSTIAVGLSEVQIAYSTTKLQAGGLTLWDVPTGLHPKPIFPGEAGLLGNGILSRFLVTFDPFQSRLILSPVESRQAR